MMVSIEERLGQILPCCPDVDEEIVRDFVSRMDPEYFEQFERTDIARHVQLASRVDPDHPCQVSIEPRAEGLLDVVIVAYDYFSELAGICGLLSAFRLDIREGCSYTFAEAAPDAPRPASSFPGLPRKRRSGVSRKKIVDIFRVRPLPGEALTPERQSLLVQELRAMVALLDEQRLPEARRLVNRRLVQALGKTTSYFAGLHYPIQIRFDNIASPSETVMDIRSTDRPGFLYTFANALAMRGIYIHKARFRQVGGELRDRLWVRNQHGHKIEDSHQQQELQVTAALIKQFSHFLPWAPDPAKAIEHFDLFLDRILEETEGAGSERALAFLRNKKTMTLLARLLGTSDFLWEEFLRRQHADLFPMLENYQHVPLIRPRAELARELSRKVARVKPDELKRQALNRFKDRELFRIDMTHVLDPAPSLPEFSRALTELAEVVLSQAVHDCQASLVKVHGTPRLSGAAPCPFSVLGMGKFGGGELGYASDIEVLFVYGGAGQTSGPVKLDNSEYFERLVQAILQRIETPQEGTFHLDTRLRPHGGSGLLANPLDELRRYYSSTGMAAAFERQALIKLRFVCGNQVLGQLFEAHRDSFVYSCEPWDLGLALDLRRQQIKQLVEPGRTNVKYSQGGLIDIEYAIQYLQLMHGHLDPRLRVPNTLQAMAALEGAGVLRTDEAAKLRASYLFLRLLIDGLRIVRGYAKDLLLPAQDSEEFVFLARRLGYQADNWEDSAASLSADIGRHMGQTREFFVNRFGNLKPASA